jgi:dimethylargininase
MSARSYQFTHALTRRPGPDIIDGLRAVDTGTPDLGLFQQHHDAYVSALRETGARIIELPAEPGLPDAVFVEDTALCLPEGAVLMHPGAPTRQGEVASIARALMALYTDVREITSGHIEGGDILVTEREILVGTSARTDMDGVADLTHLVADWGHTVRVVETPPDVLHFKTDCSLMGAETILATPRLAASGCFDGYDMIFTAEGEEACANAIRFNDLVLFPTGFPRTRDRLLSAGYEVREIGNSEAAKLDGGMSCLSLRFSPPGRPE